MYSNIQELLADTNNEPEVAVEVKPEVTTEIETVIDSEIESEEVIESKEDTSEIETEEVSEVKPEVKPETRSNKRIRELNDAKKNAESKAAQLEARLKEYESRQAEIAKMTENAELPDPSKFETMQEYVDALTEAKVSQALKNNAQKQLDLDRNNAEQAYVQEVVSNFESKVNEAAKVNPDLPKAVEHLNSLANHIPVEVRQALITDENAAQLAWEIATNQELLDFMIKGNPVQAIKVLGKLSTKYDVQEESSNASTSKPINKPTVFTPNKPKIPQVPTNSGGKQRDDSLSPKQAWKQFVNGKGKRPWDLD